MTPFTTTLSCLLAVLAGQAPQTRERDDAAHRMVIVNGSRRSVHYFPSSPGDADSYRDLERAENEAILAGDLQHLRAQYVRDEQYLQPIRRQVQERLYGASHNVSTSQNSMASTFYPSYNTSSFTPLSSPVSSSGFPLGGGFQSLPTNNTSTMPRSAVPGGTSMLTPGMGTGVSTSSPFNVTSFTPFGNTIPTGGTVTPFGNSVLAPGMGTGTFTPFGNTSVGNTTSTTPTGSVFDNGGGFFNPLGVGGLGALGGLGASSLFGGGSSFNPYFSLFGNTNMAQTNQTNSSNYSLANGMGDEGRLKTAMAAVLATQSGVDYQQRVRANLHSARAAVQNRQPYVAVTLKDGAKRSGQLMQQNGEWLVIRDGDEEHYVRTADIARMTKRTSSVDRTARLSH